MPTSAVRAPSPRTRRPPGAPTPDGDADADLARALRDRVGDGGVEPERGEQGGDESEGGEDGGAEAPGAHLRIERVAEHAHVDEGQRGLQLEQRAAQRLLHAARARVGAHEQDAGAGLPRGMRHVEPGLPILAQLERARVRDHADNRRQTGDSPRNTHSPIGERPGHASSAVAWLTISTGAPERSAAVKSRPATSRIPVAPTKWSPTWLTQSEAPPSRVTSGGARQPEAAAHGAAKRGRAGEAGGGDAWQAAHALQRALHEERALLAGAVERHHVRLHHQHVPRVEAEVEAVDLPHAPHEQPGATRSATESAVCPTSSAPAIRRAARRAALRAVAQPAGRVAQLQRRREAGDEHRREGASGRHG